MARKKKVPTKKFKDLGEIVDSIEVADDRLVYAASEHAKSPGSFSTGIPTLDAAIGKGGIPMERLTVLSGGPAAGKTTLALHISAQFQRQLDGYVIYADPEKKVNVDDAVKRLGVDRSKIAFLYPEHLEGGAQAIFEIVARIRNMDVLHPVLFVLDSINMTTNEDEMSHIFDANYKGMATQPRAFSKVLPKMVAFLHGHPHAQLYVSQYRMNVGGFSYLGKMGGGNATKFLAAVHIDIKSDVIEDQDGHDFGLFCTGKVLKNQVDRPLREAQWRIVWDTGIDTSHALMLYGVQIGAIQKGTSQRYSCKDLDGKKYKWQNDTKGWANLLKREPKFRKKLIALIKDILKARARRKKER